MGPKTTGQAIGQVVDVVMDELKKSGLLAESSQLLDRSYQLCGKLAAAFG